jgi:hypothetical protein
VTKAGKQKHYLLAEKRAATHCAIRYGTRRTESSYKKVTFVSNTYRRNQNNCRFTASSSQLHAHSPAVAAREPLASKAINN